MKNKPLAISMLLMLFISTVAIVLPVVHVSATDDVLNVLFDQDVAWAHVKVEEFADSVKWTIDLNESSSYLNNPVAGIVVIIGIGSEIEFQIHNNDGVDPHYPYGTWLISYYESGWHTGSPDYRNYPLPDGITASGGRSKGENPQMIFTVTIGKSYLANEFKWAVYFKGGSGGRTFYPADFSWYDTNTSDMATAKYLILGGAVASLAKARGTSEQYYWGSGCWAAVLGQKFEIYIDPTVPPFDALGSFMIDNISSISYHTNKPGSQNDVDFYLVIYTKPDGVDDKASWYGYKLIGEPYFSRNPNAPSNQWNKWSTDVGTNQLTFFDPDTIGFYGFYGQPTLQDIQAGPINWHDYYSGCPVTNIDYGVEIVKYISFQTGTGWMNTFQGYIDAITIALKDGTTVSVDLEGFASEVWVDDDWAGLPPGYEVEPGKFIGYNAFAKIQDGVDAVAEGGTVHVYDGTYDEQVVVGKSLVVQGYGDSTIVKPSSADKLTTVLSGYWWGTTKQIAGIVVANAAGGSVTLENIFIDGENIITKPSTADYVAGIFYRETGGTIDSVTVDDLTIGATGTAVRGYGVYISAIVHTVSVEVKDSTLTNFDKNGIDAHGDKLSVVIYGNTIIGRGPLPSGDEVQNGVVVMDGATGTINSNTISNMAYIPETWWSAGILFMDSSGSASGNVITDCQIGIMFQDSGGLAQGNTVNGGAIGLIGIWAQYTKGGTWTLTFIGNTVSGAHDIEGYENAAVGIQSWNEDASITATIESNQIAGDGSTSADGIFIGDIPEYEPAGTIKTTIKGNIISGWQCGVRFVSSIEFGSIATCNTITENNVGIQVEQAVNAANVVVNYNNIYGNTQYGVNATGPTVLDARYNWWGNASGPYHPTLNPSGTGDRVSDNVNFSPWLLKKKVPPLVHDVAVLNVVASPSRAVVGTTIQVNVTVKNEGNTYETFDVSLDYNGTLIGTQTVTDMVPGSTKILSFSWSTTGLPTGAYNLTAVASTVPGETDTADNAKWVKVKIGPYAPVLKVEPSVVRAQMVNKNVTVNVTISNLWQGWNVVCVEFRLSYNSTLLKVVNVEEGPYFKAYAPYGTFFIYYLEDDECGPHVLVGNLIMPNGTGYWAPPFPSGGGTIAMITFEVIYQEMSLDPDSAPPLTCDLRLFNKIDMFLVDEDIELVPCNLQGGIYEVYATSICDINGNYYVGGDDITAVARHFGTRPGDPRWNPRCDINGNGYIGGDDIVLVAKRFGWRPRYDP
jgi:hypothetical protein